MNGATHVSTSMLIAAAELLAARRERRHDLAMQLARACLLACGSGGERLLRSIDSILGRMSLRLAEAVVLPGIAAHYRWRKRRIHRWVRMELANGARQLLVLGAGFDALGPRTMAGHPSVRVFEIDRPETIDIRQRALRGLGIPHPRLVLRGTDLAHAGLTNVLHGLEGFDQGAATVVVAEGLLMYLHPHAVAALCHSLRDACSAHVGIIATAMACGRDGVPRFRRQRPSLHRWLAQRDEPFLWGTTRAHLRDLMRGSGIAIDLVADPDDPRDPDPCPGEWLFRGRLAWH